MGLYQKSYYTPGPGVQKDAPPKQGLAHFFDTFWRELGDLLKLNLLFILFCLPVITIPAACTALSRVSVRIYQDKSRYVFSEFITCFRAEFWRAFGTGVILSAASAVAILALRFYLPLANQNAGFYLPAAIAMIAVILLALTSFYCYPMLAMVDLSVRNILKNAVLLACIWSFKNTLALCCTGILTLLMLAAFPYTIPVVVLFYFSTCSLISLFCVWPGICAHVLHGSTP